MIFRRIVEEMKQQRWTAVGIELVILVLGVFIGIQVSNWNEERAEARLGRDYVQRLIRDLNEDSVSANSQVNYYEAVLKSAIYTDVLLRSAKPDPRELVINAYRATEITYIPVERATWDQIVSSGHLGLLPVGTVESGVSKYYSFDVAFDQYRQSLDSDFRKTVRKIIPLSMQIAIREGCSDVRDDWGNVVGFVKGCKFDVDLGALEEVAAVLRSDPAVAADLRYQYSLLVTAVLNLGATVDTIASAMAALGAEPKALVETSP